jgi:hypothetical protein
LASHVDAVVTLLKTALTLTTEVNCEGTVDGITFIAPGANGKRVHVSHAGFSAEDPQASLSKQAFRVDLQADTVTNLETMVNLVQKLPNTYTVSATTPYMIDVYEGNTYTKGPGTWATHLFLQTYWRL